MKEPARPGLMDLPAHTPRPAGAPTVLGSVLVADLSHFLAGPMATMILADMGADVIKVEPPGKGDDFRQYPPMHPQLPMQGAAYYWANRNKRSLALNLKAQAGREVLRDLVRKADVLVENFSSGVMKRFGLDYEACRAINPRLIYCSISAYGRVGDFADRLGFDPIAQAESGFISMNGYADRQGTRTLAPVMDMGTAMMASNAILGALLARERSGVGQAVELALFDAGVMMTGYAAMQQLFSGNDPTRHGNTSPDTSPSGVFDCQDQAFYINVGNDKIFERLARQVLERPDLADDPVMSRRTGRIERRAELFSILEGIFAGKPWSHWQPRMRAAAVPCGEVRSLGQALHSKESRARRLVTRIPHPVAGWVPNIRLPIEYAETPLADPVPPPAIGQHTDEVLTAVLGYDRPRIDAFAAAGAFDDVRAASNPPAPTAASTQEPKA